MNNWHFKLKQKLMSLLRVCDGKSGSHELQIKTAIVSELLIMWDSSAPS